LADENSDGQSQKKWATFSSFTMPNLFHWGLKQVHANLSKCSWV